MLLRDSVVDDCVTGLTSKGGGLFAGHERAQGSQREEEALGVIAIHFLALNLLAKIFRDRCAVLISVRLVKISGLISTLNQGDRQVNRSWALTERS